MWLYTAFTLTVLLISAPGAVADPPSTPTALEHSAGPLGGSPPESCGNVRLDSPGGSMEHVPVVDQANFQVCYAVTASELTDAYQKSHGGSLKLQSCFFEAAIGAALKAGVSVKHALNGSGPDPCLIADYYRENGSCDSKVLDGEGNLPKDLKFLSQSYQLENEDQPDPCGSKSEQKHSSAEIHELLAGQSCTQEEAANEKLATTRRALMKVLESITQRTEADLADHIERACRSAGRKPANLPKCTVTNQPIWNVPQETRQLISNRLSAKTDQPIAIGYCSQVLFSGRGYIGLTSETDPRKDPEKCDCDRHTSVIIGKRANPKTGKCEFLIQNSWGTDCDSYSGDWECKGGKIWLDADVLSKNVEQVDYWGR